MYLNRAEKEIDLLEAQLAETDDPIERKQIQEAIRDIERDMAEQERWVDEGIDKGYL